jgi:hypothetical protein
MDGWVIWLLGAALWLGAFWACVWAFGRDIDQVFDEILKGGEGHEDLSDPE